MIDALFVAGLASLALALAAGTTAVFAAHIPPLARLTGAAPLDKEDQC